MASRLRVLSSTTVYRGRVIDLSVVRVIEPGGVAADREVVRHGGTVVVLPHLDDGRLLLVRQYRYAARRWLWELVAGGVESGETPLQAARRELLEETGYRARAVKPLLEFYSSPGFLTEHEVLVEARGLIRARANPDPDETIEVAAFTRQRLWRLLEKNAIKDAKTLVGLFWFLIHGDLRK